MVHFPNSVNTIPRLNAFKKKGHRFLSTIYINTENILPKAKVETGEITVNVKQLRKAFDVCGGFVLEIKFIIEDSQWHFASLVLVAEECG